MVRQKKVVAVKLIHDIKNRLVNNLFSEFFRLFGIYVGEGYASEYSDEEYKTDLECFDVLLLIDSNEHRGSSFVHEQCDSGNIVEINAELFIFSNGMETNIDQNPDATLLKCMKETLDAIKNDIEKKGIFFPFSLMQEILPIYLKCNVMQAAMLLQYYRRPLELHEISQGNFQKALKCIENLKDIDMQDAQCYFDYARIYCMQKVNLSCYYQEDGLLEYKVDRLAEECRALIEKEPGFSNAKVLLGMICEKSENYRHTATKAYWEAIHQEKKKCYASHIYYWIGILYESHIECGEDAKKAYDCAYEIKKKYRNIYKKAKMAAKDKDTVREVFYYKECMRELEKRKGLCMDPLEAEYYFKTGALACVVCTAYLKQYQDAVEIGEKVLEFYKEYFEKNINREFEYFFGKDNEKYKEISVKRIRCQKVYEGLTIAYRELGNSTKSQQYEELAE